MWARCIRSVAAVVGAFAVMASSPSPVADEVRCGWLVNPTPANWWLIDAAGEWTIAIQGGYQAPGFDDAPWSGEREQKAVNGNYGYECACMVVTSEPEKMIITRVISVQSKPLKTCEDDPKLADMGS